MTDDEREEAIRSLLPLVRRIARRVHRMVPSVDLGDLIGDGSVGLIRAVDNFDPGRGTSLETYARRLISGTMLNGIRRMDPVSERARRALREGECERYRIANEHGYLPTMREVEELRPGFERAAAATRRYVPLSLDAPLPEGMSLPCDWSGDPAAIFNQRESRASIREEIAHLPERERRLVHAHYYRAQSLRDIGRSMNISAQRASQLHQAAVKRLRKALHASAR